MPRAAIYHRVSTLDQDPELARDELRRAVVGRGLSVELEIEETASGASADRPGLRRLLEAARRGKLDAVVVWKLDRFGRSLRDVLAHVGELADNGVRFVVVTQGIDIRPGGTDPAGRLLLAMLAAFAEFERELVSERTRLGLQKARARGRRLGRPPVPKPAAEEVANLRQMGASWSEVAKVLGCSATVARTVLALAKKGVLIRPSAPEENAGARASD